MNAALTARLERSEDVLPIRHVVELAFGRKIEADLVDALRAAEGVTLSLVAEQQGHVVALALFSPVTVHSQGAAFGAVALGPLAVLPELQRTGVGSMLVRRGLDMLGRAGHDAVIVLGHPEYYPRFGFVRASVFGLRWEHPARDEAFMAMELRPGALAGRSGSVRYREEFATV